ncbi:cupin domain-containing protein [Nesterenkonia ebinurensis]|uniref:hypothetical protein n=1 Tax=Nesterenkonia ebinurensis TaxID=2608252 RepID=UPI00123CCA99|nr:hypothetical protein [Nesterenkonia ebinurensis]
MTKAIPYEGITSAQPAMERAMAAGNGVLRLAPAWVPRAFCTPGRRIRLHPDDYFPLGKDRGGIDERWLASATRAENGPLTGPFEGLSLVVDPETGVIPFDEFIAHFQGEAIGQLWESHQGWPMYSKFFDNQAPLPFHIHHRDEHAALVGKPGKPEAYYFPPQMNNHMGDFGYTFFGLHTETTRQDLLDKLEQFLTGGDNNITALSRAYRITVGTGWDVPAGILHAPASICTYEPQAACDVFAMTESWSNNREVPNELLWKDVPEDRHGDLDFIVDLVDWERNVDSRFYSARFTPPVETTASSASTGWTEKWITYRSESFSAKELTVPPSSTAVIEETDAYGLICVGGAGQIGDQPLIAATAVRYGQLTCDEYFVTAPAAAAGVIIRNTHPTEDLVILKHFGPSNQELHNDRQVLPLDTAQEPA